MPPFLLSAYKYDKSAGNTLFFVGKILIFYRNLKRRILRGRNFHLCPTAGQLVESRAERPLLPCRHTPAERHGIVKNRLGKPRFRRRNDALGLLELGVAYTDLAVDDQPHADELGALQSARAAAV